MREKKIGAIIVAFFILIVGIAAFATSDENKKLEALKPVCTSQVTAQITGVDVEREKYRRDGKTRYRNVYYTNYMAQVDGVTYTHREDGKYSKATIMYYNPNNPSEHYFEVQANDVKSDKIWSMVILIILIGIEGILIYNIIDEKRGCVL